MKKSVLLTFLMIASLFAARSFAEENAAAGTTSVSNEELILDDDAGATQKKSTGTDSIKTVSGVKENDEELILDGGEEMIIAPSKPEHASTVKDSAGQNPSTASESGNSDTSASVSTEAGKVESSLPTPTQLVKSVPVQQAKIEDLESINFAQNLKGYRKPVTAMLLSFLLPGAGQLYCHNGLKTGIFGAIEAAIIGSGAAVYSKGKRDYKKSYAFADQHYSGSKFSDYYQRFKSSVSDSVMENIFSTVTLDTFLTMVDTKDKNYYDYIDDPNQPYIRGWDDVTPNFTEGSGFIIDADTTFKNLKDSAYLVYRIGGDSTMAVFGYSDRMDEFQSMQTKAERNVNIAKGIFTTLLINHIISMIDAGFTAKAYNSQLLGKETFWQRINIREKYVKAGSQVIPGYALEIRF